MVKNEIPIKNFTMATTVEHKVVLIGDSSVGKTAIINQFMYESIDENHQATVGIDFFAKTLVIGEKTVKMQIWDTAGQEKFRALIPSYIRDSTVALFVYDITSEESFNNLERWYKMVNDIADPAIVIVGNKLDLESNREVSEERLKQYAEEKKAKYIETSAKTPTNITELFNIVADIQPRNVPEQEVQDSAAMRPPTKISSQVNLNSGSSGAQGGCGC